MKYFNYFFKCLFNLVRIGAEICVFSMIGLLAVDVFGRYVLNKSTLISYDMTGYFLVGITYLGLAYSLRQGAHIRITVLVDRFKPKFRKWWIFFIDCIALFFIIVLFMKSVDLVRFSLEVGIKATSFMGEPMWIPQIIVPIGLGMYIIEDIRLLFLNFKELIFKKIPAK